MCSSDSCENSELSRQKYIESWVGVLLDHCWSPTLRINGASLLGLPHSYPTYWLYSKICLSPFSCAMFYIGSLLCSTSLTEYQRWFGDVSQDVLCPTFHTSVLRLHVPPPRERLAFSIIGSSSSNGLPLELRLLPRNHIPVFCQPHKSWRILKTFSCGMKDTNKRIQADQDRFSSIRLSALVWTGTLSHAIHFCNLLFLVVC